MKDVFENLRKENKKFSEFEKLLNLFVAELIDRLVVLTGCHFNYVTEDIEMEMKSQQYFKMYGYMICKEIQQIVHDLGDDNIPVNNKIKYHKKGYPLYDKSWVEQRIQKLVGESSVKTKKEIAALKTRLEKERVKEERYQKFEKAIHKELKKLVLKHCPYITGISGDGLRQIDYMLQDYMFKISEILRKNILISVPNF